MAYDFKRRPLEDADQDRIVSACKTPGEKAIVIGLLETGLRVSELARLRSDHILWQQRRVKVFGKGGPYGSHTEYRVIPLSDALLPIWQHHFALREDFSISKRTIQRVVGRVSNRGKVVHRDATDRPAPVTPHVLRHTFAVNCIRRGISLSSLQKILGHDRLTTTEIYLNLSPEQVLDEFHSKWGASTNI